MFELSFNDGKAVADYFGEDDSLPPVVYDFTFENRIAVAHITDECGTARYYALDKKCNDSYVFSAQDHTLSPLEYSKLLPDLMHYINRHTDYCMRDRLAESPVSCIEFIFASILPEYGFAYSEDLTELCKTVYRSLFEKNEVESVHSPCENKVLAYLVAGIVASHGKRRTESSPKPVTVIIPDAKTLAAAVDDTLPALSAALERYGLIRKPINAVELKNKSRFFCQYRYRDYIRSIAMTHPVSAKEIRNSLSKIDSAAVDLDRVNIPDKIRNAVSVRSNCYHCRYRDECGYQKYRYGVLHSHDADLFVIEKGYYDYLKKPRRADGGEKNTSGGRTVV